jgi:hypothetical protein
MSHVKSQQSKTLKELSAFRLQPRTGTRKRRARAEISPPQWGMFASAQTGSRWSSEHKRLNLTATTASAERTLNMPRLSRTEDMRQVRSCIPGTNLMQLLAGERRRNLRAGLASVIRTSRINNPKGTFMKCASVVKAAAAVIAVVGLAACTDLKPIQAQIDDLKAQLAKTQGDISAAKSGADQANAAAQSASQAASGAQSTANQALAAAHASQSCCDATNEKIDRMFKRSVSK